MGMKKLEWCADGQKRLPIVICGKNEKFMLMTLAILQNNRKKNPKGMHYIDPRDREPLKL
jgi:hypothetical protein